LILNHVKTTGYLAIDLFKLAVMGPMEVVVEGAGKKNQTRVLGAFEAQSRDRAVIGPR
jgi:hypothetical protein